MKFSEILNEGVSGGTIEVSSMAEYNKLMSKRADIVSRNRSNAVKGKPSLPVPPKPVLKKVPVAYDKKTGEYHGRLNNPDECPEGCKVKWETPKW